MKAPINEVTTDTLLDQIQSPTKAIELDIMQAVSLNDSRDLAEIEARKAIEEFMKLPPKEREAKVAAVYDRGILNDRLHVDLPDDLYGEWENVDPLAIRRKEALGFWIDNNYANKRQIHSDGTSSNKIGDVVFMVTMRSNKEMIDKIMQERQSKIANNPRNKQDEEQEFVSNVTRDTGGVIPAFSDGREKPVSMDDVRSAIAQANSQTQVQR